MQAVSSDFYHRFQEAGNTADWQALVISVRADKVDACSICWEQCWPSVQTPCSHAFHPKCLAEWLRFAPAPTCPLCRGSLGETAGSWATDDSDEECSDDESAEDDDSVSSSLLGRLGFPRTYSTGLSYADLDHYGITDY